MADFHKALKRTAKYEGGYVNDPADAGGETYKGISRRANPKWDGWQLIDAHKKNTPNSFKKALDADADLQKMVDKLYLNNYWTPIRGCDINSQRLAEEIFDMAVNAGVTRSIKLAQKMVGFDQSGVMTSFLIDKLNRQ